MAKHSIAGQPEAVGSRLRDLVLRLEPATPGGVVLVLVALAYPVLWVLARPDGQPSTARR